MADLGTCKYDEVTCSATVRGDVVVWQKPVKGVQFKIQTKLVRSISNSTIEMITASQST